MTESIEIDARLLAQAAELLDACRAAERDGDTAPNPAPAGWLPPR